MFFFFFLFGFVLILFVLSLYIEIFYYKTYLEAEKMTKKCENFVGK